MLILDFRNKMSKLGVFSLSDINMFYPNFDSRRLFEWQKKGYILKLRKGWYCFSDTEKDEFSSYFAANRIYSPSYISLESALSYHSIIPEAVYPVCSITTNKTMTFYTPIWEMRYNTVKPSLFFGYEILDYNGKPIKIAYPEKAILDILYLRSDYNAENELIDSRFALDTISKERLFQFLAEFKNRTLGKRVKTLMNAYDLI